MKFRIVKPVKVPLESSSGLVLIIWTETPLRLILLGILYASKPYNEPLNRLSHLYDICLNPRWLTAQE